MSDISFAFNVLNNILMEAELKDSFGDMPVSGAIRLELTDGSERLFQVIKNEGGRIVMADKDSREMYTFTKDSLKNGILTLYEYDSNSPNKQGKEHPLDLKSFYTSKVNGDITIIDVVDDEMSNDVNNLDRFDIEAMNETLKTVEIGDMIIISSEEKISDDESKINNILFKVIDLKKEFITTVLYDIETNDGDNDSKKMLNLIKIFKERNIFISADNLIKPRGNTLVLPLSTTFNSRKDIKTIELPGIIGVEVEKADIDDEITLDAKKEKLINKIKNTPEFNQALAKTPNFWETLMNSSYKGIDQIEGMLNNYLTNNSYLTVGSKVMFKLIDSKTITLSNDLRTKLNNTGRLVGRMQKNNKIRIGDRVKSEGYWELKLIKQISDSKYTVNITHCDRDDVCSLIAKNKVIDIIKIEN